VHIIIENLCCKKKGRLEVNDVLLLSWRKSRSELSMTLGGAIGLLHQRERQ
jgi:hypothetical protein